MRKRNIRLLAALAAALCALAAAAVGAMLTSSGGGEGAAEAARESLAEEAQESLRSSSRQATRGTPLPMAREKLAGSKEAAREIWAGPSAEVYADHAYPHASIDFAQVEAALAQAKAFGAAPTFVMLSSSVDGTPGFSSFDICGAQCSYDMPIASPPGKPDEVWIGGVTQGSGFGPSTDKGTGYVVANERARTNNGTLWAATRRGRVFIAKNADSNDPAKVVSEPDPLVTGFLKTQTDVAFKRIDTAAQPMRFVSGISVDPRDASGNTAFVSFSGYNAYTPATPGHVFKAVYNPATGTATWTNLDHNLGDLPILDVEVDAATGDLYAAHDYGVLRLPAGAAAWVRAADGLPKVAVYELSLTGGRKAGDRTIYAATHGRGGFRLALPKGH